jgi:hypothetical protein
MQPSMAVDRKPLSLASFTANDVRVSIQLQGGQNMVPILSATFTPPDGYHLYSKDTPLKGLNGLGRPTLLELTAESHMQAISELMESVEPQVPNFEPKELLVYPSGEVTLSVEVQLPPGDEWVDDSVSITYMACSDQLCKPPVVGKIVAIRIPAADFFNTP